MHPAHGARLMLAAALAVALATPACKRKAGSPPTATAAPRPALGSIVIENLALPRPGEDRIDADALEKDVRQALMASGMFTATGGNVDAGAGVGVTARARIAVTAETVELDTKGEARAQVRVRVDSRPADAPGAVSFDVGGQGVEPYVVQPGKATTPPMSQCFGCHEHEQHWSRGQCGPCHESSDLRRILPQTFLRHDGDPDASGARFRTAGWRA